MKITMDKKYKTKDGIPMRIICVDKAGDYPVVTVTPEGTIFTYTDEGKICIHDTDDLYIDNTRDEYDLVEIKLYDDFKIDEPVMVRSKGMVRYTWIRAYFAGVNNDGLPCTWNGGATSWSTDGWSSSIRAWDECRRPTEEEEWR